MEVLAHRNCCGMSHISGMGNNPHADHGAGGRTYLQQLDYILAGRDRRRTYEVVLNGRQEEVWGELLIARGGVKVAEFVNQLHNSRIHVYYWNDDLNLFGREQQPAQVLLPPAAPNPADPPNYAPLSRVPRGTRVQVWSPNLARHGMVGVIETAPRNAEATDYHVRIDGVGLMTYRIENLRPEPAPAVPIEYPMIYVHPTDRNHQWHNRRCYIERVVGHNATVRWQNGGNDTVAAARLHVFGVGPLAAAREAPAIRRELLVEYVANLRTVGRRGPFTGVAEARAAFPRCRSIERRVIFSDGTVEYNNVD